MNLQTRPQPTSEIAAPPLDLSNTAEAGRLRTFAGELLAALGGGELAETPNGRKSARWTAEAAMLLAEALVERVRPSVLADPILKNRWWEQPRVPAGNAEGGQWTEAGGGTAGDIARPDGARVQPMAEATQLRPARLQPASATVRAPSPAGETMNDFSGEWVREPSWETGDGDDADGEVLPAGWSDSDAGRAKLHFVRQLTRGVVWQQALAEVPKWILRQDADFRALMDFKPPRSPDALRVSLDNVGHASAEAFARVHGSAPPGFHDLHAVERSSIDHAGVTKEMVYHTRNTFRIPALIHIATYAYYSSKPKEYGGLTVRHYMRNLPFEEQLLYAIKVMRQKGALK